MEWYFLSWKKETTLPKRYPFILIGQTSKFLKLWFSLSHLWPQKIPFYLPGVSRSISVLGRLSKVMNPTPVHRSVKGDNNNQRTVNYVKISSFFFIYTTWVVISLLRLMLLKFFVNSLLHFLFTLSDSLYFDPLFYSISLFYLNCFFLIFSYYMSS